MFIKMKMGWIMPMVPDADATSINLDLVVQDMDDVEILRTTFDSIIRKAEEKMLEQETHRYE